MLRSLSPVLRNLGLLPVIIIITSYHHHHHHHHHHYYYYYYNQAGDETNGDGLQLNLQIREMCKNYHKPHGPALATLNVTIKNGRPAKQCKELLGFLKDQILPKTLKLINLKKIKDMKDEEKNELGANWLSCIRPGKTMKRFVASSYRDTKVISRISPIFWLIFLAGFLSQRGYLLGRHSTCEYANGDGTRVFERNRKN